MSEYIINIIENYGLIAIFLVIMLEYACFPVPSELVLPLSGAVAAQGEFAFLAVLALSLAAGILGSYICYFIGRLGGVPLVNKISNRFPSVGRSIKSATLKFEKYSRLAVMLFRLVPLCRTYISFAAGISKQNVTVFTLFSAIGITVWNTILIGFGYVLSANWQVVMVYYDKYKLVMLALAALLVGLYIFLKVLAGRKEKQAAEAYDRVHGRKEK